MEAITRRYHLRGARPVSFIMLFRIHLIAGLIFSLYMLLMSASGAALLFRPEIQTWVSPELFPSEEIPDPVSIGDAARSIAAAHPALQFVGIGAPTPERQSYLGYVFDADDGSFRAVIAAADTGAVLGSPPDDSVILWLQDLHFNLLSGTPGRAVNGIAAIAFLLMAGTGYPVWHSRSANRLAARAPGRKIRRAHAWVGAGVAAWIAMWGVTGVHLIHPEPLGTLVRWLAVPQAAEAFSSDPAFASAPKSFDLNELARRAERDGRTVSRISLPTTATGTIQVVAHAGDPTPWEGDRHVYFEFDRYTGEFLGQRALADRSSGARLLAWMGRVHMGGFGGEPVRFLWALAALAVAGLSFTGWVMWWKRRAPSLRGPGARAR